jgi:hypothetical protein
MDLVKSEEQKELTQADVMAAPNNLGIRLSLEKGTRLPVGDSGLFVWLKPLTEAIVTDIRERYKVPKEEQEDEEAVAKMEAEARNEALRFALVGFDNLVLETATGDQPVVVERGTVEVLGEEYQKVTSKSWTILQNTLPPYLMNAVRTLMVMQSYFGVEEKKSSNTTPGLELIASSVATPVAEMAAGPETHPTGAAGTVPASP